MYERAVAVARVVSLACRFDGPNCHPRSARRRAFVTQEGRDGQRRRRRRRRQGDRGVLSLEHSVNEIAVET